MNALLTNPQPLPSILYMQSNQPSDQPSNRPGRRRHIGDYTIDDGRLDCFNVLLNRLDSTRSPLDCDRVATAARELCDRNIGVAMPICIGQRMRRVAVAAWMVADPGWTAANDMLDIADLVVGYVRGADDLIPDRLPRIGRLDDAIVVDAAWPRLAGEVADYVDFRRLHRLEAALRGLDSRSFRFGRADWEEARQAEAAFIAHRRSVRMGSYLSSAAAVFRVH